VPNVLYGFRRYVVQEINTKRLLFHAKLQLYKMCVANNSKVQSPCTPPPPISWCRAVPNGCNCCCMAPHQEIGSPAKQPPLNLLWLERCCAGYLRKWRVVVLLFFALVCYTNFLKYFCVLWHKIKITKSSHVDVSFVKRAQRQLIISSHILV
jgi:hypothetical protein